MPENIAQLLSSSFTALHRSQSSANRRRVKSTKLSLNGRHTRTKDHDRVVTTAERKKRGAGTAAMQSATTRTPKGIVNLL
jgi:hypothetical protein